MSSTGLLSLSSRTYASHMRETAKWVSLLFIAIVALSPVFEVFDNSDGFAQDMSDLARYALCLFCFLTFALRRTVFTLRITSVRKWIGGSTHRSASELQGAGHPMATTDRALFLTLHDLRI